MTALDPAGPVQSPPKTSSAAIWSLVLGILSMFCLWILGSIPAIILGIIGMRKADADPANVGGKGIALAGIITGGVGILSGLAAVGMFAAIAIPATVGMTERANQAADQAKMRQVVLACQLYALNNENNYPEKLEDLIPEYLTDPSDIVSINRKTSEETPFLYRSGLTTEAGSGEPLLLSPRSHLNNRSVVYADGSLERLREPLDPEILKHFQ